METSLSEDTSMIKYSQKSDQLFSRELAKLWKNAHFAMLKNPATKYRQDGSKRGRLLKFNPVLPRSQIYLQ